MTASKEPDNNTPKPKRAADGTYLPGICPNPSGRPRGSRNAITMTLKDALEESFIQLGGTRWLMTLAVTEPRAYASLLARLLPPPAPEGDGTLTVHVIGGFSSDDLATPPDDD